MGNRSSVRIAILAATKMYNGICVAGVDTNNRWIRPVSPGGLNFSQRSLSAFGRVMVEPYNEIEFRIRRLLNNSPQSEDVEVTSGSPNFLRTLNNNELQALSFP